MAGNVPVQVAQVFRQAGISPAGTAGILGNFQQESSGNPASPGGYLGQWQGPRLAALQSFAQQQGRPVTDPVVQAQFTVSELKSQYPGLYGMLRTTSDPRAAALAVSQQYERPGVPMNQNRENFAVSALQQIGGAGGKLPSIAQPQGASTGSTTVTTQGFDQAGFKQAMGRFLAGQFVQQQGGSSNPYNAAPGTSKGFASATNVSNPLLATGQLTTKQPSPQDFVTTHTATIAQHQLQQLAGPTAQLATHPAVAGSANKILQMALSVLGAPYNQATHASALTETAAQLKKTGTDCSGFVSWLMGPDGLGIWKTALATPDIQHAPGMQPGTGHTITVYNNPLPGNSGHVFVEIGGRFFQSAGGGVGIQAITSADAQQMIKGGDNGAPYTALHPKGF